MHVHLEPWPMLLDHMVLYQPHVGQQCEYLAARRTWLMFLLPTKASRMAYACTPHFIIIDVAERRLNHWQLAPLIYSDQGLSQVFPQCIGSCGPTTAWPLVCAHHVL